jgi:hypothetical protein
MKYCLNIAVAITIIVVAFVAVANLIGPIEESVLDDGSTCICTSYGRGPDYTVDPEIGDLWIDTVDADNPFKEKTLVYRIKEIKQGYYKASGFWGNDVIRDSMWTTTGRVRQLCDKKRIGNVYNKGGDQ